MEINFFYKQNFNRFSLVLPEENDPCLHIQELLLFNRNY
jgi:hypothetical protein